jgi:hypothetical protein
MKTPAVKPVIGILTTISLLAGAWLLGSCATEPIELAPGTHWRDAAKVAGQPEAAFSYQMNGRKYDRVIFGKLDYPVVLENGRVFSVDTFEGNERWNRRFSECLKAGELPFENGLGPLHSLVIEQKRENQKQLQPPKRPNAWEVADNVGAVVVMTSTLPIWVMFFMGTEMDRHISAKNRKNDEAANAALLDCGVSYANFLARLGKTDLQATKGSYRAGIYFVPERNNQLRYTYTVGTKNGRVLWVASNCVLSSSDVFVKMAEYLDDHR